MWKKISENYECSDDGHIRNRKTKKILKEYDSCKDGPYGKMSKTK